MLHGLYAITDNHLTPPNTLLDQVAAALRGGAQIIQFRDKISPPAVKQKLAQDLRALTRAYGASLIINDDVTLAAQINADGVHLGQQDTQIDEARWVLGTNAIIGATCHGDIALAQNAVDAGANYLAFGRFFPSNTKPGAPLAQLDLIAEFIQQCPLPSVAIGGITLNNAQPLLDAGFAMLAVVQDVFDRPNIEEHCQHYQLLFSQMLLGNRP